MTLALTGHAVASGIAIGRTHLVERNELEIEEYRIDPEEIENEITRYHQAVEAARKQLLELAQRITRNVGKPAAEIIQTHIVMLGDDSIKEATEKQIQSELCNAEWALQSQLELILSEFRIMDDPYLRSRGEDITQVVRLVQSKLDEKTAGKHFENIPDRLAETMVIATELTPGELAILHERGVAGIVTEHGGPHSHTAILASSLGIPAILGVRLAQTLLREGETLVLDGDLGVVYAGPDEVLLEHYHQVQRDTVLFRKSLEKVRELPCNSIDGESISLQANSERREELLQAVELGATGIGLYRTEFLHLRGMAGDEETQLNEYLAAIKTLDGLPLTIRTLDIGADKSIDSAGSEPPPRSANPAMGLRAIRLCLRDTDQFKKQLRAILRASASGPVRCLIPMLTSAREVVMVRSLLDEAREELDESGIAYDPNLMLGGMIEVPAAALAIEEFSEILDFISVGTNDLLQYMLAADRSDEEVAHLYDLQHPGVVRLLQHIFRSAQTARLPVTVCGEVAGNRRYTRLLLALGLREFSMHPSRLLEVKQVVTETDIPRVTAALTQWLNASAAQREGSLFQLLDQSQQTH